MIPWNTFFFQDLDINLFVDRHFKIKYIFITFYYYYQSLIYFKDNFGIVSDY